MEFLSPDVAGELELKIDCRLLVFFVLFFFYKINFFTKFIQEHSQCQFGS